MEGRDENLSANRNATTYNKNESFSMINTKYKIQKNTKSIANVPEGGGENLSANRNATTYNNNKNNDKLN